MSKHQSGSSILERSDFALPRATINYMTGFEGLVSEYPTQGQPGITHRILLKDYSTVGGSALVVVHVSLMRGEDGEILGVLKHFPVGRVLPVDGGSMVPGEYVIGVRPSHQGQGVGLELLRAADQRWNLNFWLQHYTPAGRELVIKYLSEKRAQVS